MKKFALALLLLVVLSTGIYIATQYVSKQIPSQNTPESASGSSIPADRVIQDIPSTNEETVVGVAFQGTLANMSMRFVEATTETDALFKSVSKLSKEQRVAALDQVIQKWEYANNGVQQFSTVVELLPSYHLSVAYDDQGGYTLIPTAHAGDLEDMIQKLDDEEKAIEAELKVSEKEKELGREKILEIIDKAPPGEKLKVAAELFGTDARNAYAALTKMRGLESKIGVAQSEVLDTYSKTAQVVKTGAKVAVFIGGLAPAAGGSAIAFAGKAGIDAAITGANFIFTGIAGAGLVMEVSNTAVSIGVADADGKVAAIAKAKDAEFFKQMSFVVGIMDPLKAIGQLQKLANVAGGVKNLLTPQGMKKIAENPTAMKDLKADTSGNLQTIVDAGPTTWKMLSENPTVKSLLFNSSTGEGFKVIQQDEGVNIIDEPTAQAIDALIQKVYAEAEAAAGEVSDTITEALVPTAPEGQTPQSTPANMPIPQEGTSTLPATTGAPSPVTPPATISPTTTSPTGSNPTPESLKPSYNGSYSGSSSTASGVASGSVTVNSGTLSGGVTYRESAGGQTFSIGLSVSGSVNEDGKVSGRFSGSKTFSGKKVSVSGSFSGSINGNTMSLRFSGTSSATGSVSGSISLYR